MTDAWSDSLTVVIVTFNSAHCVGAAVDSVAELLPDCRIIVVDNASDDGTADLLARDGRATVVRLQENVGFGRAVNCACTRAPHANHLLVVNPDAVLVDVQKDELARALSAESFGQVVPLQVADDRPECISGLRRERHWLVEGVGLIMAPFGLPALASPWTSTTGKSVWGTGSLFLVRVREFQALGGFDPSFFLYWEDRDLSRRYRANGYPVTSTAAITGRHAGGASSALAATSRWSPRAWSLLGYVEYTYKHHGRAAGFAGACLLRIGLPASLVVTRLGATLLCGGRLHSRARAKSDELVATLNHLRQALAATSNTPPDAWPRARPLMRRLLPIRH